MIIRRYIWCLLAAATSGAATNHYLFLGHPRADGPGEIVQREVERIDFSSYDLLMTGGDYTWHGTGSRSTVAYLDAVFGFGHPAVLAALGNHDTAHKNYFTEVTGRPAYYTAQINKIMFVVLDTTDDGHDILGGELQMLQNMVNTLSNCTHLVIIHHHFIWLSDYAPLAYLYGDDRIGASSARLSGLNFYDEVYPLLLQAVSNGVEVLCVAGDRTGSDQPGSYGEFHIDHTTADGIHFLAAGLKEELPASLRTAIVFTHDTTAGILSWQFLPLADLPRIPDEPLVITELHYNPSDAQGDPAAFIELMNRGDRSYDLSEAAFAQGVSFTFPTPMVVAPGERILVAADPGYQTLFAGRVFDYDGAGTPVAGEPVWLRNRAGLEVDYVPYGVSAPWPPEPDNSGPSLMLIRPDLNNELAENWAASDADGGTPGGVNFVPPSCTNITFSGSQVFMTWTGTVVNGRYRLEWTTALEPPTWQAAVAEARAGGGSLPLAVTNSAATGFYRLQRRFPDFAPASPVSAGAVR